MRTKIGRWGNSAAARIPKDALEAAGMSQGAEVEIVTRDGVVELRLPKRRQTVEELFAEYEKKYGPLTPPEPVDWGPDVGAERWPDEDWSDIAPPRDE